MLVAVSLIGGRSAEAESTAPPPEESSIPLGRDDLLRGIPQDGVVLGKADAPLTLVEYADLQCPFCAEWAREAFPTVVDEYVRAGKVRLVFRGLSFVGPDSEKALRAALAAGGQNRLWDVVHALYVNQGAENEGWVTDELLRDLGRTGLDADEMLAQSSSTWVDEQKAAAASAAEADGVNSTPSFQAGPTGGALAPLQFQALDAASAKAELDRLLAKTQPR